MESAFGVDHGYEIEKAMPRVPGMGGTLGGAFRSLGTHIGMGATAGAQRAGKMAGKSIASGNPMTGRAQIKVGQGLKRTGNFAMKRPGMTGGLAAGGAVGGSAALGAGGATAMGNNRRRY